MSRVSASSVWLLRHCQYWARPEVVWGEFPQTDGQVYGTKYHALVAEFINHGVVKEADLTAGARQWCSEREVEGYRLQAEPAHVWDWERDHTRFVGIDIARQYNQSATELGASADVVGFHDDHILVGDWDTGISDKSDQLKTNGLAISRFNRDLPVKLVMLRVDGQGNVTPVPVEGWGDAFDLDEHGRWLRDTMRSVSSSKPQMGDHCTRCPALETCPAVESQINDIIPADHVVLRKRVTGMTPNDAALKALFLKQVCGKVAEILEPRLKQFADATGGIVGVDGKVWRKRPWGSAGGGIDGERALALAERLGASEQDIASCLTPKVQSYQYRWCQNEEKAAKGKTNGKRVEKGSRALQETRQSRGLPGGENTGDHHHPGGVVSAVAEEQDQGARESPRLRVVSRASAG